MDKNHPACKNEVVVYRFEPIAGVTDRVLWLADKILDGKRVPMGRGEMTLDSSGTKLTWDFTIHETRRIWQLEVENDSMTGTLVQLPDRTLSRKVSARRVKPEDVPEAPPPQAYEE